ncbi:MAG TPA: hypothetical protein VKA43_07565 [Gammaproteobacteria bacterium]|nr:hypothetical protein [Gammaproteobacteria bacterium]
MNRALAAWVLIIAAETVHGILRQWLLVPVVGDLRARQIGVLIGSAIIFAIAWALARWIDARSLRAQLAVGAVWVVLTLCFEYTLGRLLGLPTERILADYDVARGGFMLFGLVFMLIAPALAARAQS